MDASSIANLPQRPVKALLITNSRRRLQISAVEAHAGTFTVVLVGTWDLGGKTSFNSNTSVLRLCR